LPTRKVVRLDFRKGLAIAAAVCVVLLVAAALLLPRLVKFNTDLLGEANSKPAKLFGEPVEAEEELRVDVAGVENYARVEGVQLADETRSTDQAVPVSESAPAPFGDHFGGKVDFLAGGIVANREGTVLYDESIEEAAPVPAEADRLTASTGMAPARGLGLGTISGKAADGRLALGEQWSEPAPGQGKPIGGRNEGRARNRPQIASKRELADLVLPELQSEDRVGSPDEFANYGMYAGFQQNVENGGSNRSLNELKSNSTAETAESVVSFQKNLAQQPAQPTGGPVPGFENRYALVESSPSAQPKDGADLYWFQNKSGGEPGEPSVTAAGELAAGLGESNFTVPSPGAVTKSGATTISVDSLHSISEAEPPKAAELFKSTILPRPTTPPTPRAVNQGIDDNGRTYNWRYESANNSGLNLGANAASGRQGQLTRDIPQRGEEAARQWGASRTDVAGESRNQLALPGGMGGMGMGGGGFVAGAYADGLAVGQLVVNGEVAAGPVSGGIAGTSTLGFDVDGDGGVEEDGKLYGFGRGQAAKNSTKELGAKGVRRFSGRFALDSIEGESVKLGQAPSIAAAAEAVSGTVNEQIVHGFVVDKSAELGKGLKRDQSGAEALNLQSELSRAEAAALARGAVALGVVADDEVAKESDQAEAPALGDVPALGRMFKRGADPEKPARDLSAVQLERSADTKSLSERGRASGESARQSLSLGKQDKDRLSKLPVEEYESLAAIDESLLEPGSDQQQALAERRLDESLKSPATRQPQSLVTADQEMLRRKGKLAANKKLPAPAAKPQSASRSSRLRGVKREEKQLVEKLKDPEPTAKPPTPSVVYTPRPETVTAENNFSTFSLNVSDVSFNTALASLQADKLPAPGDVRSEEFLNALEYRDPMPGAGEPLAFHWERARSPFTHDRDIIRFAVRTAALGRQPGRAINLVCLLDNSGSMEREDRVSIVQQALGVLARKLTPNDRVSLVTFARTPKLRIDGMRGGNREAFLKASTGWIPQGGTHVEKALALAYETAKKHFIAGGNNRVILLTDGAANMGNVDPYQLRKTVESHRKQGIALDCFGIGWEGYNDNLLEVLARNGDGRYGFLNQPAQAVAEFEQKLLGAFQVAASDVKVQVEWNAGRVKVFRQVGYLRHQLKKEDFRNNKIDAAEISAAESGNALYVVQVNPDGEGPLGMVRVRYKVPFTREYTELEWSLAYEPAVTPLEQAGPAMRLGCVAATFAEWLAQNPYAQGVQLVDLQGLISGIPSIYGTDPRPNQLEWMIGKARILAGN
jgi:Mg-chelatase subunit ChlD